MFKIKIPRLDGDFDQDLERVYRRSFLKQDIWHTSIFVGLFALAISLFFYNDFQLLSNRRWLFLLLCCRGIFLVSGIFLLYYLLKNSFKRTIYEIHVFGWGLAGIGLIIFIDFTRPASYTGDIMISILTALLIHLITPLKMRYRMIMAGFLTAGVISLLVLHKEPMSYLLTVISMLFIINLIGIAISLFYLFFRRRQFSYNIKLQQEIRERLQTEKTLAESRARLSALLESTDDPIWSVEPVNFGLITFNSAFVKNLKEQRGVTVFPGMTPEEIGPEDQVEDWKGFYR